MPNRLTHESVEAAFVEQGYTLLSKYETARVKNNLLCPNGHKTQISWNNFSRGRTCVKCSRKGTDKSFIINFLKNKGCTFVFQDKLTKKINYICPKGHMCSTLWGGILAGNECAYCAGKIVDQARVERAFKEEGYQLLSEYKNNREKLKFICPNNHSHSINWDSFLRGRRCAYCSGRIVTHEEVNHFFLTEGYTLLSQYKKATKRIEFICPNGHRHHTSWASFRSGNRCAYCAGHVVTHEQVRETFMHYGYTLVSEYIGANKKIKFICPSGHKHLISWGNFRSGRRCAKCTEKYGFKMNEPATLYYIRFDFKTNSIWKIGITNGTIKKRFEREPTPYVVLWQKQFNEGCEALDEEQKILKDNKQHLYGGNLLKDGNSECFCKDIFGIRNSIQTHSLI